MNEFERLLAFLQIAYQNLTALHRHLVDDAGWFENHKLIGEWYGDIADQLDDLTETGIALGYQDPSIKDAILVFGGDLLSKESRELKDTLRQSLVILRSVAGMMEVAKPIVPPSVASKLDEYIYHWNKEANYKIAHALGNRPEQTPLVEDDED